MHALHAWSNAHAAAVFVDVTTSNTLIPKTQNKNHVIEVFVSRATRNWLFEVRNG